MDFPRPALRHPLDRRTFLRGTGAFLALPLLEAMTPAFARAAEEKVAPRRMLAVCNNLGFVPDQFFPKQAGPGYELSPYLNELAGVRDRFTVFEGVSHPGVDGSHASDVSFPITGRIPRNWPSWRPLTVGICGCWESSSKVSSRVRRAERICWPTPR